ILLKADRSLAQRKLEDARKALESAHAKHPDHLDVLARRVSLAQMENDDQRAQILLGEAQKQVGDTAGLRLVWTQYWARKSVVQAQPALIKLAEGVERYSTDEQARLLSTLGDNLFRVGAKKEAEQLWERLARQTPHDLRVRI